MYFLLANPMSVYASEQHLNHTNLTKVSGLQESVDQIWNSSFMASEPGASRPSDEPVRRPHSPGKAAVRVWPFQVATWPRSEMSSSPVCMDTRPSDQLVPFLCANKKLKIIVIKGQA